ncbi:hypothetical protein AB7M42_007366 [Bradyrhizobium diazoefficiens]|uniref:Uncharacterized protein n=1 Tax=Bradyrhizobium diazoefficiens TaxID=1355477 RepID=A0A810ADJ8_9BRAD|nr:hypothetical protein [Bradyrhizobium japonicum]BBZ92538.1 hypothetical protein F07S3_23710 [Bradyrhizobium diazoefficiens]MBP1090174.1 hypothetical protein [Bradyrhizobium japonicum]MCS3980397.1 hypothetical protein [Bradyrhizobium japonicum]BCA01665.1 hypothetical protein H12S4_25690 [Bradyrhizobium diazoefficiens]
MQKFVWLATNNIDGVLVLNVGDTAVQQQYAGPILSGPYSGPSTTNGTINTFGHVSSSASLNGTSSGTITRNIYSRSVLWDGYLGLV